MRYFFFFFVGLCAAHVSHNELSPPGYRLAFGLPTSSIRRSVATLQRRSFQRLILAEGLALKSFLMLRYLTLLESLCFSLRVLFLFPCQQDYLVDIVVHVGEGQ